MKNSLIYGLIALFSISLFSCGDDEAPASELVLGATQLTVLEGTNQSIEITSGNGDYKVVSSDDSKAIVSVSNKSIVVEGKKQGTATITVTDGRGKKATVGVTVTASLSIDKDNLTLKQDEVGTITIAAGEGNYTVSSQDEGVATAVLEDSKVKITGIGEGNTVIIVTDTKTKVEKTIAVTVTVEELTLDKESITIPRKNYEIIRVTSFNGRPYEDKDKYEVTVTQGADLIAVESGLHYEGIEHHFKVKSTGKIGTGKIAVKDLKTKRVKEVSVTVEKVSLNVLDTPVTLELDANKTIRIKGNGEYTITGENGFVTTQIIKGEETDVYDRIKIIAVKAGTTTLTVSDNVSNESATIAITVNAKSKDFEVDGNGKLIKVKPSVYKSNLTLPVEVKEIPSKYESKFFNENSVIVKITMLGVVKIGKFGFSSMDNLEEVIMGENVKEIEFAAFANNKKLKKVTVKAMTPPTLKRLVFNGEASSQTLYVPAAAVDAYKKSDWKDYFSNIQAISAK